jgi:TetR/AcrR family transcriptional regulator, acrAB operon repressor
MARRTKKDALATRDALLDAAELLFQDQGVSRTSLNDIARKAGTSRGAIYWHFKDKSDLFNAMMERVTLPLDDAFQTMGDGPGEDPLERIRQSIFHALQMISGDSRTRRVFEVLTQKVEYIEELQAVRSRHLASRKAFLANVENGLKLAAERHELTPRIALSEAARGLHAVADGLIQNWLLDREAFDLVATSTQVIDTYLTGLGFKVRPPARHLPSGN